MRRGAEAGIVVCLAAIAGWTAALLGGSSFAGRWFYLLSWPPLLAALDLTVVRLGGPSLFRRYREIPALVWWSAVIWLVFEAFNFRLQNWYYVNLEPQGALRWVGTVLAFGTVVPAIVLPERVLDRVGLGHRWPRRPLRITPGDLTIARWIGLALLVAVLVWPRYLFLFVWGGVWLVVEPMLWSQAPEWSLWRDLAEGRWGRTVRLLVSGLFAGLCWEGLNIAARAKWIYTVPFLEEFKLFEMPALGFLGFPFFALEAWSAYHLIVAKRRPVTFIVGSVIFAGGALVGMERWTVSSTAPVMADLAEVTSVGTAEAVRRAGIEDVWALARSDSDSLVRATALPPDDVNAARAWARLVTLRGIGSEHGLRLLHAGLGRMSLLARASPAAVLAVFGGAHRPTPAEVRVWIRAARQMFCEGDDC